MSELTQSTIIINQLLLVVNIQAFNTKSFIHGTFVHTSKFEVIWV